MAVAGINETILQYQMESNSITSQLTTVMFKITSATKNDVDLTQKTNKNRAYLANLVQTNPTYADTTEYKVASAAVEDDYQVQLAEINSWESELEQQKNSLETRAKEVSSFQESWTAALKQNIKKDFTYGTASSSSS